MALRIKELRQAKGWTQEHLADASGMSRSQLAMIEAGTRPANTLRLAAIATALGITVDDLFPTGKEERYILDILKRLPPDDRAALVRMAEALASKLSKD